MKTEGRRRRTIEVEMVGELVEEIYRTYFLFRQVDEGLHGTHETTEAERGPLFVLFGQGSMSVPALARLRTVTRQRMQQIVNRLADMKLVERRDNPASDRSPLYALTARGRKKVMAMLGKERKLFRGLSATVSERRLRTTLSVLREIREAVERGA